MTRKGWTRRGESSRDATPGTLESSAAPAGGQAEDEPRNRSSATRVFVIAMSVMGAIFIVLGQPYVPAKYFYDSDNVQNIARGLRSAVSDKSFQGIGQFYQMIGMSEQPLAAKLLGFLLYACLIYLAIRETSSSPFDLRTAVFLAVSVLFGSVYLGQYSKDVLVLAIVAVTMSRVATWKWDILLLAMIAGYAYSFRSYWLLVGALYVVLRWYTRGDFSRARIALVGASLLAGLAIAFRVQLGVDLDHYRQTVNAGRIDSLDAQTMIHSMIPMAGVVGDWLNSLVTLATFAFPVPLVLLGGVLHLVIAVFATALWLRLNHSVGSLNRMDAFEPRTRRCLSLVLAFTLVQSVFEPDYGSYIRHLTPLLPAMLMIIWSGLTAFHSRDLAGHRDVVTSGGQLLS